MVEGSYLQITTSGKTCTDNGRLHHCRCVKLHMLRTVLCQVLHVFGQQNAPEQFRDSLRTLNPPGLLETVGVRAVGRRSSIQRSLKIKLTECSSQDKPTLFVNRNNVFTNLYS